MNIRQLLRILLARKGLMLGTVASTVLAAAIVTLMLPPRYTATATIVIDFKAVDPVSGNILPVALLPGYLATQLDILSSQNVALKAVDRLKLSESTSALEAFQKSALGQGSIRHWLADGLLKDLALDTSRESSMVRISYRGSDPKFAASVSNAIVDAYINTNLELKTEPARLTTAFFDEQLRVLKENLDLAQRKLSAYQRGKGITATDERYDVENARLAELSSQVVAAQAQTFDTLSRRKQVDEATATGDSADALSDVLNNPVIQSLKSQLTKAEARLGDLSGRVGRNHPQYQSALAEVEELKRKLDEEMSVVARSVSTNSSLAAQRERALRNALAAQRARVLDIKKQRDEAALLIREVENAQKAYDLAMARFTQTRLQSENTQTNIAVINRAIAPTHPSSPKLPLNIALAFVVGITLAGGLGLIAEMRDRIVRSEDDVVEAFGGPVIGRLAAEPTNRASRGPAGAQRALGAVLIESGKITAVDAARAARLQHEEGLLFGEACIRLGVVTPDDIEQVLSGQFRYACQPGSGNPYGNEVVAAHNPSGSQSEALRALRTQLLLRWMNPERKVLAICSPARGDGRSYLAANLAVAFSQLGARTLLIDADMRNGRQHQIFNLADHGGLSTALSSGRAGSELAVIIPHFPRLSVLAAGPVPPNPLELLSRPEFLHMLHELEQRFEFVLIDTPAAISGSDAQMIAVRAGGALMLAREGHTRLEDLRSLAAGIAGANGAIAGCVYNRLRKTATPRQPERESRLHTTTQASSSAVGAVGAASPS
ncbi:MAG TPA: chain length determinant protein EpsF [Burkholderiales bacterium]|nr:chain length determinant protein EpsF [Burkholderiales bacterium]